MLEFVVEFDPVQAIIEVFRELWVVNPSRAIDICSESKRDDFILVETQRPEVAQALDVFEDLEEALIVLVELSEHLEQV